MNFKVINSKCFSDSKVLLTIIIPTSSSFKDFTHIHKSLWGKRISKCRRSVVSYFELLIAEIMIFS